MAALAGRCRPDTQASAVKEEPTELLDGSSGRLACKLGRLARDRWGKNNQHPTDTTHIGGGRLTDAHQRRGLASGSERGRVQGQQASRRRAQRLPPAHFLASVPGPYQGREERSDDLVRQKMGRGSIELAE